MRLQKPPTNVKCIWLINPRGVDKIHSFFFIFWLFQSINIGARNRSLRAELYICFYQFAHLDPLFSLDIQEKGLSAGLPATPESDMGGRKEAWKWRHHSPVNKIFFKTRICTACNIIHKETGLMKQKRNKKEPCLICYLPTPWTFVLTIPRPLLAHAMPHPCHIHAQKLGFVVSNREMCKRPVTSHLLSAVGSLQW